MRHRVLLIEDSPANRAAVVQYLDAYGYDCDAVASLEQARSIIDSGEFCAILTDLEILPTSSATKPDLCLGYAVIEYARTRFPAYGGEIHLMPILVMSAHAKFDVLRRTVQLKADDFLRKPPTELKQVLSVALEKAGRQDHARCPEVTQAARLAATTSSAPPQPAPDRVRLSVFGRQLKKNLHEIALNGRAVAVSNATFVVLLRLVVGRLRGVDHVTKRELGGREGEGFRLVSVLQKELRAYLPAGLSIYEVVRGRGYRLSKEVDVSDVDAAALGTHDDKRVRDLAATLRRPQSD
jgi:CheY-like chemotaxis protein